MHCFGTSALFIIYNYVNSDLKQMLKGTALYFLVTNVSSVSKLWQLSLKLECIR